MRAVGDRARRRRGGERRRWAASRWRRTARPPHHLLAFGAGADRLAPVARPAWPTSMPSAPTPARARATWPTSRRASRSSRRRPRRAEARRCHARRVPRPRAGALRRRRRRRRARPPAARAHGVDAELVLTRADRATGEHGYEGLDGLPVLELDGAREERFDVAVATWWETTLHPARPARRPLRLLRAVDGGPLLRARRPPSARPRR